MKKIFPILLTLIAVAPLAYAQSDSNVYNERVIVQTHFKPVVEESTKLRVAPVITDTVATITKSFVYDLGARRLTSLYEPSRIKAARIIGEPATKLYNNYLRLGFGNYWSPLAELYLNSTRNTSKNYGFRATHRSSWGEIGTAGDEGEHSAEYYGQVPFSLTDVSLFGKMITKGNLQLSGDLGYEHDMSLYYGFPDSTLFAVRGLTRDSLDGDDYKITYHTFSLNLGVKSLGTNPGELGYEARVNVTDMLSNYRQNEFQLGVDGNIHYGFAMKGASKGVAYLHLTYTGYAESFDPMTLPLGHDAALAAALLDRDDSTGVSTLGTHHYMNLYKANPYLEFLFSGFQIHAGATVAMDAFNYPNGGKVHVYPDAYASKSLFHDFLNVTLSALGNVDANSWNEIRCINPYIAPDASQRATSHYDFAAKLRLNFSKKINAHIYGEYSRLDDDLSFALDPRYELGNVFQPVYDSLNRIKVGASVAFVNDEMLRIEAKGNYYIYKNRRTETVGGEVRELPLYYRPSFDAGLSATINWEDKIIGRVEFLAMGRTAYDTQHLADGSDSTLYLPWRYGLNLEVEYRHNKALSFFLKADNLLFQRYFYWQNYPSYCGLILVGMTYTIPNK